MGLLSSFRAVVAQKMDDNPAVVTWINPFLWLGAKCPKSTGQNFIFHLASKTFHFTGKRVS